MAKSTHFTGQPIFNQLLALIPRSMVRNLSQEFNADRYCKHFGAYEHLVTMLYATFNRCTSLREVVGGMQACSSRLHHLGIRHSPRRSTLSDANNRRSHLFFEAMYHGLYRLHYGGLPDSLIDKPLTDRLYIVDSTTISLFSQVLQGAGSYGKNGKKKGGIKAHMCVRAMHDVSSFICLTAAKANDNTFLPRIQLPEGSIVVFDKGYRSYQQLHAWSQQGITWISRLVTSAVIETEQEVPVDPAQQQQGVCADTFILLGNPATAHRIAPQPARLICFYDEATGKTFKFITNNRLLPPAIIAGLYKRRWQIELMFKRIKSAFQLHFFVGDSENAIRLQLWCTLIADLLLKIVKDRLKKHASKWSMANLTAIVRLHLTTYIDLIAFLRQPEKALIGYQDPYHKQQLALFPT